MRSWAKPTAEDVDRAVLRLSHKELSRYFFDRLENPEWIQALRAKGFFASPPQPVTDEAGKLLGWPPWPEGRYLARMAQYVPEVVVTILLEVPSTLNPYVHQDYFDAACRCPASEARRLLRTILEMTSTSSDVLIPERLCELAEHLAKGNQFDAVEDVLQRLFEPLPGRQVASFPDEEMNRLHPRPIARFGDWALQQAMTRMVGVLAPLSGLRLLQVLCGLLDQAVRLGKQKPTDYFPDDSLAIERPAIDDQPDHRAFGIIDVLVTGVRDCADLVLKLGLASEADVLNGLEQAGWSIFRRIALHLLRGHPSRDLVAARLTARSNFDDPMVRREYALLAREHFELLNPQEQDEVFGWVLNGPDLDAHANRVQAWSGKLPTGGELEKYKRQWQLEKLGWLEPHLRGPLAALYSNLRSELGEPEPPGAAVFATWSWIGPTSPKSEDELRTLAVPDLTAFLRTWRQADDDRSPSPEGLARTLSEIVAADARRFAEQASAFVGLDPTYVRALFRGLRDALRKGASFPWGEVIDLARWVVSQPRAIEGRKTDDWDQDPHWGPCRGALATLLEGGFRDGDASIPFTCRTETWSVLQPLTQDPDPRPEDEVGSSESSLDPATRSINSTRGEAMHAVVHYALWVRRNLERLPNSAETRAHGFKEMPEVKATLDQHLDLQVDRSPAIRSVYGQYFIYLHLLDPSWAEAARGLIFPSSEDMRMYWTAAWKSYLVFCRPLNVMLKVLEDSYRLAIVRSADLEGGDLLPGEPLEHLAAHLMVFYWRGVLTFEAPLGLLGEFWRYGSSALRAQAIAYIGRSLHVEGLSISSEELSRLKRLWENRLQAASSAGRVQDHVSELSGFGWWVGSGRLEPEWTLENLEAVLALGIQVEDDLRVMSQLSRLAERFPMQTTRCASGMVRLSRNPWEMHIWRDDLTDLLAKALDQPNPDIRLEARLLVDHLGQRGFADFGRLLPGSESPRS